MTDQEKEDIKLMLDDRYNDLFAALPENRKTFLVSWAAVEVDTKNIPFVPSQYLDDDFLKMVVKRNGVAIEMIPPEKLNQELVNIAVRNDPNVLSCAPEKFRSADLCLYAVKRNENLKDQVPAKIKTKRNIYSFSLKLDKLANQSLSYEQCKKVYGGVSINLEEVHLPNGLVKKNVNLRYLNEDNRIRINPIQSKISNDKNDTTKENKTAKEVNKNNRMKL